MPRHTKSVTVIADGRDNGKTFLITEMPASQAEKWAFRALSALAKAGVDVPEDVAKMGLPAIATLGIKAVCGMDFAEAEPLMDEMFACIQIIPDMSKPEVRRGLIEADIEEVKTRVTLRKEWLALHTGFSFPAEG